MPKKSKASPIRLPTKVDEVFFLQFAPNDSPEVNSDVVILEARNGPKRKWVGKVTKISPVKVNQSDLCPTFHVAAVNLTNYSTRKGDNSSNDETYGEDDLIVVDITVDGEQDPQASCAMVFP